MDEIRKDGFNIKQVALVLLMDRYCPGGVFVVTEKDWASYMEKYPNSGIVYDTDADKRQVVLINAHNVITMSDEVGPVQ